MEEKLPHSEVLGQDVSRDSVRYRCDRMVSSVSHHRKETTSTLDLLKIRFTFSVFSATQSHTQAHLTAH